MPSVVQTHRLARIRADREDIVAMDDRISRLEQEYVDAQQAYESARVVLAEKELELKQTTKRRRSTYEDLEGIVQAYRRDFMATLPADVLSAIFNELIYRPGDEPEAYNAIEAKDDAWESSKDFWSFSRITAPSRLAAVCRRWRVIALDNPLLWSSIHIPAVTLDVQGYLDLMLQRSKNVPLDITLWDDNEDRVIIGTQLLRALAAHAERWRRVELFLPRGYITAGVDVFGRPTPCLEQLFLLFVDVGADGDSRLGVGDLATYWPFTPRLRRWQVRSSTQPPLRPQGPLRLTWFDWRQPDMHIAWSILSHSAPTLRTLTLSPLGAVASVLPPLTVPTATLPDLQTLYIGTVDPGIVPYLLAIRAPTLRTLFIRDELALGLAPVCEALSASLTSLSLAGDLGAEHLKALRSLSNLQKFDNIPPRPIRNTTQSISDGFFSEIAHPSDSRDYIWPKLSSITLSENTQLLSAAHEGLLDLVRSRTAPGLDARSTPRRLAVVQLGGGDSKAWIRAEISRMVESA